MAHLDLGIVYADAIRELKLAAKLKSDDVALAKYIDARRYMPKFLGNILAEREGFEPSVQVLARTTV